MYEKNWNIYFISFTGYYLNDLIVMENEKRLDWIVFALFTGGFKVFIKGNISKKSALMKKRKILDPFLIKGINWDSIQGVMLLLLL